MGLDSDGNKHKIGFKKYPNRANHSAPLYGFKVATFGSTEEDVRHRGQWT